MVPQDVIPQEKSDAVARALNEAFGVTEIEDISAMTGGHTNSLVFRIIVRGSPYLLKIILRTEDPTRHYTSMKAAAEAGVAPRVWYTNTDDRIAITDFVKAQLLPVPAALVRLPAMLRTLHALPPFGRAPFNTSCTFLLKKGPMLDGFLQKFQAANLLPQSDSEELLARHAELAAVYPRDDEEMVSSHNDLFKPDNMLFDGQHVWVIDWEAAFLNDRYADLAAIANQIVADEEEEVAYLTEYFGRPPDEYQGARFYVMQQIAHVFYTMAFLHIGPWGATGEPIDWSEPAPEYSEYHRRIWAGEDLLARELKHIYGRVHWERLLQNVKQPRYREALRIVAAGKPVRR